MSKNERIKRSSPGLFFLPDGTPFAHEIDALTAGEIPTIGNEAKELSKFFGVYKQQARGERGRRTGRHMFMVRIKLPAGGELTPAQWMALDDGAELFSDRTLRLTTRQAIQYHWVGGTDLAPLIRHLSRNYRDDATLGACGDVNRNVMASPLDGLDPEWNPGAPPLAEEIASALAPQSSSFFQVWGLDAEGNKTRPIHSEESLYGPQYLPRKFKIGLAHARDNSVDLRTQDIGLLPIVVDGRCDGSLWDLYSGGGMGMTHNNPKTAALLGLYLGRLRREQVVAVCRGIAILQRDNGERKDRRQARWKYTIRRLGLDKVKTALREKHGIDLEDAEPQPLPEAQLFGGLHAGPAGTHYYGLSIDHGRISRELRTGIRKAVETQDLRVRVTAHQDLVLCGVRDPDALLALLDGAGAVRPESKSKVRQWAMACPAKPTCGLAMTEAERILPTFVSAIEEAGFGHIDAEIRMTGCPNNCTRPPAAEIGIFGYGKNDHVVLVGGSRTGSRVGKVLYSRLSGEKMIPALVGIFRSLDARCGAGQPAGDWLWEADLAELRGWIGVEDAGG
jgi:sulfite reductase (ferredoxin)